MLLELIHRFILYTIGIIITMLCPTETTLSFMVELLVIFVSVEVVVQGFRALEEEFDTYY